LQTVRKVVFFLLFLGALAACNKRHDLQAPEPGTELFAVLPDSVNEVLFSSSDRKLYAYRWTSGQPFQIMTSSRGLAVPEHCAGGVGFQQLLQAIARVKIVREVDKSFDTTTSDWADVELKDATVLEPISMRIRVPRTTDEPVVIQVEKQQFVVDMYGPALARTRLGCSALQR
jgi:hypothetical protein